MTFFERPVRSDSHSTSASGLSLCLRSSSVIATSGSCLRGEREGGLLGPTAVWSRRPS
jgi:hypothetical protein